MADLLLPKRVFPDTIDHGIIGPEGILFQTPLQVHIPGNKLNHRHLPAGIVDLIQQITLDHFFFLPQFLQRRGVDIAPFLVTVPVIAIIALLGIPWP